MTELYLNGKFLPLEALRENSEQFRSNFSPYEQKVIDFCHNWLQGKKEFAILTSGSTGNPKKIILFRERMEASARMTGRIFSLESGDPVLICLSVEYIAGMMMLVRTFVCGLKGMIYTPEANPLKNISVQEKFNFTAMTPLQLAEIFAKTPEKISLLNDLKNLLIGGADLSPELEKKIQTLKVPVFHSYGMTETVSHIALRRVNGLEPEMYFQVPEEINIGIDQRGCLTIQGEVTGNELIITNDLVIIISPKEFLWLGRIDLVINSGGHKINLEKLEKEISQIFSENKITKNFLAAAVPDVKLGKKLVLLLEKEPLTEEEKKILLEQIRLKIHKYEVPKDFFLVDSFLFTKTGKLDRTKTLKQIFYSY